MKTFINSNVILYIYKNVMSCNHHWVELWSNVSNTIYAQVYMQHLFICEMFYLVMSNGITKCGCLNGNRIKH